MGMNAHNVRVDDDLWNRAGARAAVEGTNLSSLIRQWLEDYADNGAVGRLPRVRLTAVERKAIRERLDDAIEVVVDMVNEGR